MPVPTDSRPYGQHIIRIAVFVISASAAFGQSDLVAIDILIQPDPKMMEEADYLPAKMTQSTVDTRYLIGYTLIHDYKIQAQKIK